MLRNLNRLVNDLMRIDYFEPVSINVSEVKSVARDDLPVYQTQQVVENSINSHVDFSGKPQITQNSVQFDAQVYSNREQTTKITVTPKYILLEELAYNSFNKTSAILSKIFNIIRKNSPELNISRIGVRYINNVDLTTVDRDEWSKYLKTDLISSVLSMVENSSLVRTQNMVELRFEDYIVRSVSGFINSNYPANLRQYLATLDYDAFIDGSVSPEEVEIYLAKFHTTIKELFRASLTENFFNLTNGHGN